jgi:ABC-type glycerol-3-phosphate transport system substrate-binding protein
MRMEGRGLQQVGALTALLVVSLMATGALAQDARLAEGRKEGKVVWYTGAALFTADNVAKRFEQAYPGIKVEVHRWNFTGRAYRLV